MDNSLVSQFSRVYPLELSFPLGTESATPYGSGAGNIGCVAWSRGSSSNLCVTCNALGDPTSELF